MHASAKAACAGASWRNHDDLDRCAVPGLHLMQTRFATRDLLQHVLKKPRFLITLIGIFIIMSSTWHVQLCYLAPTGIHELSV